MQRAVRSGHALDGGDLGAVDLRGQHVARLDRATVDQDGAGAALCGVATDVRAGECPLVAQELDEQRALVDGGTGRLAVDGE